LFGAWPHNYCPGSFAPSSRREAMRRWGRLRPAAETGAIDLDPPWVSGAGDIGVAPAVSEALPSTPESGMATPMAREVPRGAQSECLGGRSPGLPPPKQPRVAGAGYRKAWIPIAPIVSLAFEAAAASGQRRTADPSVGLPAPHPRSEHADTSGAPCTLVWLRPFDLRLHDHAVLDFASGRGAPVQVTFVWSPAEDAALDAWAIAGTAAGFWLQQALAGFDSELQRRYTGMRVAFRVGASSVETLLAVAAECGADEVVTSRAFDLPGMAAEYAAAAALKAAGLRFRTLQTFLLHDIGNVRIDLSVYRGHFGTLTPFHTACRGLGEPPKPIAVPRSLQRPRVEAASDGLKALQLARMPVRSDGSFVDWGAPILAAWDISEEAALATLQRFLAPGGGFFRYEKSRNLANASAVARVSPYLRFGMLSPRTMYWAMKDAGGKEVSITFWRRLVWRDLAYWQLRHFPEMQQTPIRRHYVGQKWNTDKEALMRWQQGRTGYPLVDAGMRELWATGWMAQNVRMAAAVMLCELLNINWVEGEKWFHHTLVDADPAINAMMWQNAGKGGLDQWNFSVHPGRAGRGQDPTGEYTRRWVPELAKLPTKFIHTPWEAPDHVLRSAGVVLGSTYPDRIVKDVSGASRVSGDCIRAARAASLEWNDGGGYDLIMLPRGSTLRHDGQRFRIFTKREFRIIGGRFQSGRGVDACGDGVEGSTDEDREVGIRRADAPAVGGWSSRSSTSQRQSGRRRWREAPGRAGGNNRKSGGGRASTANQHVLDEYMQKAAGA